MNNSEVQKCEVKRKNKQFHKCGQCPKAFLNIDDLTMHVATHKDWFHKHVFSSYVKIINNDIFKCDGCQQGFLTQSKLMLHRLDHIQKPRKKKKYKNRRFVKSHKCPDCDYRFVAESTLKAHSILHQPFPHICDCGIGYYKPEDLTSHKELMKCQNVQIKEENPVNNNLITKSEDMTKRITFRVKRPPIPRPPLDIVFPVDKEGRGQCPECLKWFTNKFNARFHYRSVHRNERPHICTQCNKSFTQPNGLNLHLKMHLGIKDFKCRYCPKAFYELHKQIGHERTHTGEKPYKCKFCEKAFSDSSAHGRHERIHTADKRYRCALCPMAFTDHSALYAHRRQHDVTRKRNYSCEKCEKRYYCKDHLKKHVSIVHNHEYNFICDYCDQKYKGKRSLIDHIQRWHTSMKNICTCKICSKVLLTEKGFKDHMKVCNVPLTNIMINSNLKEQTLKKTILCGICNRVFFCERSLNRHLVVHIKSKSTYECDYCGYTFTRRCMIIKHIVRYHTKKKYVCDHCNKQFAFKTSIRKHMMTNHLEVLRCNICYKRFYANDDLKRHKMTKCTVPKYTCDTCGKLFKSQNRLRIHKIRHKNLESFKCPLCARKFAQLFHVKRHLTLVHKKHFKSRTKRI